VTQKIIIEEFIPADVVSSSSRSCVEGGRRAKAGTGKKRRKLPLKDFLESC
jgi:hypothetical protein